ncbi:MAG: hypothetical protein R6V50_00915 [Thermoplasmatota archaeon]
MKHLQKTIKKLKQKDDGIAGIVVAVLLIALIISVVAIIQTVFVPQWMEQKEAEHLQNVFNQFNMMKYAIDTQALTQNPSLAISTSITLGNKELPILSSVRSYGYLAVNETKTELKVREHGDTTYKISQNYGIVQYSSSNAYFLDKTYIYEAGAIIVSQYDGNVMAITPNFDVYYDSNAKIVTINFSLINTKGVGDRQSIGGYGTYPIRAQFQTKETEITSNVESIQITTDYKRSWEMFLKREFSRQNIPYEGTDAICSISQTPDGVLIEFYEAECSADFEFTVYHIIVQISPGWIE